MFLQGTDKHGREAEKNLDLRIRKTRRAIRSGLVKACQAKPYAHVSVTDICAASMVSRTTFYDHYTDKDALLAEVVSFLLDEITPALEGLWFGEGATPAPSPATLPMSTRATARLWRPCSLSAWAATATCTSSFIARAVRYLPIGRVVAWMTRCCRSPPTSTLPLS